MVSISKQKLSETAGGGIRTHHPVEISPATPLFFYLLESLGRFLLQIMSVTSVVSMNAGRMVIEGNSGIIMIGCSVSVRLLFVVSRALRNFLFHDGFVPN